MFRTIKKECNLCEEITTHKIPLCVSNHWNMKIRPTYISCNDCRGEE